MTTSLCLRCQHCRNILSGKGSVFLLCEKAASDAAYPKYPRQPLTQCEGFQQKPEEVSEN